MNDAISTRKIPKNTRLRLVFLLGIFLVEMSSFMFLSQHRDGQAIFYLLNIGIYRRIPICQESRVQARGLVCC